MATSRLHPTRQYLPGGPVRLGRDAQRGDPVFLTALDRNHHTLISGTTGIGKSSLLGLMIRQIINDRAVAQDAGSLIVFDPHLSLGPSLID